MNAGSSNRPTAAPSTTRLPNGSRDAGPAKKPRSSRVVTCLIVAFAALSLAALFWWPLFRGGGFIGGDIYSYYLPQRAVYAGDLAARVRPLWNNRAGHGYPIVGESQTGPFYPPNVVLYGLLPLNAAYNVNHLLHYVLAFVLTWLYARSVGLSRPAAGLGALTYTYGWFPARCSLEWAIIGGAWLPAALWCVEKFFATRGLRYAMGLCGVLTLQLLAGHFNLAFLTQLTLLAYIPLRLFLAKTDLPAATEARSGRMALVGLLAMVCAFGLSAVQIAPSWELKKTSQRAAPGAEHRLAQGSIPYWYLSQAVAPWHWYSLATDRNGALRESEAQLGAPTNQVEAHLYFGLVPLALALTELCRVFARGNRLSLVWAILAIVPLFYATGCLVNFTRHVPGFNFFQGPGRYGLIATLAVGVLAGRSLDHLRGGGSLWSGLALFVAFCGAMWTALTLTSQGLAAQETGSQNPFTVGSLVVTDFWISNLALLGLVALVGAFVLERLNRTSKQAAGLRLGPAIITVVALLTTALDLWLVSRVVRDSQMVGDPPIDHLGESPIGKILREGQGTTRVFEPHGLGNLLTVFDTSKTPVYLTFGPAAYTDPKLTMPLGTTSQSIETHPLPEQIDWLRRAGVTHVLSTAPLNETNWPVRRVWTGFDPVLNPPLARYDEPLYLYELLGTRGRVAWEKPAAGDSAKIAELHPNRIVIEANSASGGRLILTELLYPGWDVTIDGAAQEPRTADGMFRAVDVTAGRHAVVWSYHPRSLYWGLAVSGVTFLILATLAHLRFWHPRTFNYLDPAPQP